MSEQATNAYELTRAKVAQSIGVSDSDGVVFVRGPTEGINLIAQGFVETVLKPRDDILIMHMERHARFLPWKIAVQKTCFVLKVVSVDGTGVMDMDAF